MVSLDGGIGIAVIVVALLAVLVVVAVVDKLAS